MTVDIGTVRVTADNINDVLSKLVRQDAEPQFIIVDLFCGAGGTTTGFELASRLGHKIAKVIACVNHDPKAIISHWLNNPEILHFEEDIRTLDLRPLVKIVEHYRCLYPNAILILWASLECTNFSKAKGGQPRDPDSRTLADHLHRYITAINPDYVQIENVVEFMSWGPLDENGKPVSRKAGEDWLRWRKEICALGYRDEWRELNSADFGAYTSRNRLFGCFAKPSLPITWPQPTHSKKGGTGAGLFAGPLKWKPVKDVLDFSNEGESIFNRKKDLSPKTLERILAGLIKYIAGGETAFMQKHFSGKPAGKVTSVASPAGTLTTSANQSIVQATFMLKYNSMTTDGKHMPPSIESPAPVLTAQNRLGLAFITKYYSSGGQLSSVNDPAGTLTTTDRMAKVQASFISKDYTGDKHRLVQCVPFVMNTSFGNIGRSIEEPAPPLLASRRHHYIVNPSHGGYSTSTDKHCPVIIARQDKAPLYLLKVEEGDYCIPVYDTDHEVMVKIKKFMAEYGISDIKMRMLNVAELIKIQGFPSDYRLYGNQSDQKKFIGNSVVPVVIQRWAEALYDAINPVRNQIVSPDNIAA